MARISFIFVFILAFLSVAAMAEPKEKDGAVTNFHDQQFIWGRKERVNHGSFRSPKKHLLNPHHFQPFDPFQDPIDL